MASNPHDINQLRERLRALGYLDAPVDRYVLGSAASPSGAARFALGAGLRVGLIAGLLLGISAAIALAARAPGFVASRRDGLIMAAALSAVFALVSALGVAAVVMAASWIAGRAAITPARARRAAAIAGVLVALGCAAYLTLWWNAARDLFTGLTLGWHVVALALAAGVALLFAHAVSVVIQAALVRSTANADIAAGGLLSSRGFLVAFGLVLFAGSGALLATGAGRGAERAAAPDITVTPTGYAVRVVAIDGVDVAMARNPGLRSMSRLFSGAHIPLDARGGGTPDPARDWTTLATGRAPEAHGITSLEARRAVGMEGRLPAAPSGLMRSLLDAADLLRLTTPAIASGEERRVPAFWEVAAAAGLRTAVVNWWATWPAPEGDDVILTDRAILRLDTGGALDAEIAPAALYEPLRTRWPAMRSAAAARAAAAFANVADPDVRKIMTRSAELDILVAALANVNPGPPIDLQAVYLPGLDIAQHNLLQAGAPASVSAMSGRVSAIERYYALLDELVAELLPPSASHIDALILWPGRVSGELGAMLLTGAPIEQGTFSCEECGGNAVAGTLLYLLGLPISEDLRSRPDTRIVTVDFLTRHPARRIANYSAAVTRRSARTGEPLDAEALERLRSLGYIR